MRDEILAGRPSDNLRVYAVWLPMLVGDGRFWWDGSTLPDPRVSHYWDEDRLVGTWFAREVDGYEGVSWDTYFLYGPEAAWDDVPGPLADAGGTVFARAVWICSARVSAEAPCGPPSVT